MDTCGILADLVNIFLDYMKSKILYKNMKKFENFIFPKLKIFFTQLTKIPEIKVYPSKVNFALIELIDGSRSSDFVIKMLIKYGRYDYMERKLG